MGARLNQDHLISEINSGIKNEGEVVRGNDMVENGEWFSKNKMGGGGFE